MLDKEQGTLNKVWTFTKSNPSILIYLLQHYAILIFQDVSKRETGNGVSEKSLLPSQLFCKSKSIL